MFLLAETNNAFTSTVQVVERVQYFFAVILHIRLEFMQSYWKTKKDSPFGQIKRRYLYL